MSAGNERSRNGIVVAAGGTGGHIFPVLAVWEEIHRLHPSLSINWLGSTHRLESKLITSKGIQFIGLRQTELRRKPSLYNILYNIRSLWFVLSVLFQTVRHLLRLKPRLVLTSGGFTGGAAGLASWITRTPLVIIEPNAYPGLTNRLLGKIASMIFVTYPDSVRYFPPSKTQVAGTPARREVVERNRIEAREEIGIADDMLLVFVTGGSQGASGINDAMPEAARTMVSERPDVRFIVIHQCGAGKKDSVKVDRAVLDENQYRVVEFIEDAATIFAASDIVVSRSGASTLAEIASRSLPSILIPYRYSSENHQGINAKNWEKAGAALYIEEKDLNASILATNLLLLLTDRTKRDAMGKAATQFGDPAAAQHIAFLMESLINK
jgi:UDP-N-acetylglucosamine--N-acetylmuramyl-(pentapeptide) pyrophosphoryl-undecaprenol N-acetylglucosamine transferase